MQRDTGNPCGKDAWSRKEIYRRNIAERQNGGLPWYCPSNLAIFPLPVIARTMRQTCSDDSVPELVKRTISTDGTRAQIFAVIFAAMSQTEHLYL